MATPAKNSKSALAETIEIEAARLAGASSILLLMDGAGAGEWQNAGVALAVVRDVIDHANETISQIAVELRGRNG